LIASSRGTLEARNRTGNPEGWIQSPEERTDEGQGS